MEDLRGRLLTIYDIWEHPRGETMRVNGSGWVCGPNNTKFQIGGAQKNTVTSNPHTLMHQRINTHNGAIIFEKRCVLMGTSAEPTTSVGKISNTKIITGFLNPRVGDVFPPPPAQKKFPQIRIIHSLFFVVNKNPDSVICFPTVPPNRTICRGLFFWGRSIQETFPEGN